MNCPNCGATCAEQASECAKCEIIFAKWKKRAESGNRGVVVTDGAESTWTGVNPWHGRLIAAAVVAAWMVLIGLYYRHHQARVRRKPLGELTGDYVELRDPQTGDMKRLPIRRGPGVRRGP